MTFGFYSLKPKDVQKSDELIKIISKTDTQNKSGYKKSIPADHYILQDILQDILQGQRLVIFKYYQFGRKKTIVEEYGLGVFDLIYGDLHQAFAMIMDDVNIDLKLSFEHRYGKHQSTLLMFIAHVSAPVLKVCLEKFIERSDIFSDKWIIKQLFEESDTTINLTAFMYACHSNLDSVKVIMESKWFKLNHLRISAQGHTIFMIVNDLKIIEYILDKCDENTFHFHMAKKNYSEFYDGETMLMKNIKESNTHIVSYLLNHKWFTLDDLGSSSEQHCIKNNTVLGNLMKLPYCFNGFIDKLNKNQLKTILLNTDMKFITSKSLDYIIQSKGATFLDFTDDQIIKIWNNIFCNKIKDVDFTLFNHEMIIKILSSIFDKEQINMDMIEIIIIKTDFNHDIIKYIFSISYYRLMTNILPEKIINDTLIDIILEVNQETPIETLSNNKWNLLMIVAKYNPSLLKKILIRNTPYIDIMKNYRDANMLNVNLPDKIKNLIDNNYHNFDYLYIVVFYHPEILSNLKEFITERNKTTKDSIGYIFYEYLYATQKETINSINLECPVCMDKQKDIVLVPCGHTLCSSCSGRIKKCHICKSYIEYYQNMFL